MSLGERPLSLQVLKTPIFRGNPRKGSDFVKVSLAKPSSTGFVHVNVQHHRVALHTMEIADTDAFG